MNEALNKEMNVTPETDNAAVKAAQAEAVQAAEAAAETVAETAPAAQAEASQAAEAAQPAQAGPAQAPSAPPQTKAGKNRSGLSAAVCVLVCICLLLNLGTVGILGYLYVDRQKEKAKQAEAEAVPPTTEDDVLIFDQYTILSTKQISDAYKSGDTSALSDADKETLEMAKAVLDEYITDGMPQFEEEVAIYLYLTQNMKAETGMLTVISTTAPEEDTPHGVLKNHTAVCVGYATTFRLFMQMLDIPCMVVHSADFIHSWDLVQLDGDWYHVDCYSDQNSGNFSHFNIPDSTFSQSYGWDKDFFPAANGTKYDYMAMNATELDSIYDLPAYTLQCLQNKQYAISATFKEKITPDLEPVASVLMSNLTNSISMVEGMSDYYAESSWRLNADGDFVACIVVDSYSDPEPDLDEETMQKILDAVNTGLGIDTGEFEDEPVGEPLDFEETDPVCCAE